MGSDKDYRDACERCSKLERTLAGLRQELNRRTDQHDPTLEYLLNAGEAMINAARLLAEMRLKPVDHPPSDERGA